MAMRIVSTQSTEQEVANYSPLRFTGRTQPRPYITYRLRCIGARTAQVVVTETIWPTKL